MNIKAHNVQTFSGLSERFGVADSDTNVNVHYLYPLNYRPTPRGFLSGAPGDKGNRLNINVMVPAGVGLTEVRVLKTTGLEASINKQLSKWLQRIRQWRKNGYKRQ